VAHGKKEDKKKTKTELLGLKETDKKSEKAKKHDVIENAVLEEILAWENKLSRCERLEEQLKMRIVNRAMAILHSVGNVHAKTMTTVSKFYNLYLKELQRNIRTIQKRCFKLGSDSSLMC
jgi:phosphoenolpyruvate-protein kinase (PTS system EI component)